MRPWRSGNAPGSQPEVTGSSPVGRSMKDSKVIKRGLALATALFVSSCTPQQAKFVQTAIDAATGVCEVIVASTDPGLAPVCSSAEAVAEAIAALVEANSSTQPQLGVRPAAAPYRPSGDEVYAWLVAHGAKHVEH